MFCNRLNGKFQFVMILVEKGGHRLFEIKMKVRTDKVLLM
jgi:hypothetical protein